MRLRTLVLLTGLLLISAPAQAESIGMFGWTYDVLFGTGSTFSVSNESGDTFEDVFVDLFAPSATDPFQSLALGDVLSGESSQSIDDLSFLLVPDDLSRAVLRLTFAGTALTATLGAVDLVGDPLDFLAASIEILAADAPPPQPVPEPSTLLLLASGFTFLGARRLRARSNLHHVSSGASAAVGRNP